MNIPVIWLRAHRWPTLLAVCAGMAVVNLLLGATRMPLLSVSGVSRLEVPLAQFLPLILACAAGLCAGSPSSVFDVTPRSSLCQRLALALTLQCTVAIASLTVLTHGVTDWQATIRNTLALTGMALATATLAGATRGWTTPLFYVIAAMLFGPITNNVRADGIAAHWAFPLARGADHPAAVIAAICWVAGTALFVLREPRADARPTDVC